MAGSFPTAVTIYTNPAAGDGTSVAVGTRTHSGFHGDVNDDLEQVMTKLGIGASVAAANTVLRGTGSGTTAFGQIVSGDITDGTIVNDDINAAAAIAKSKLAALDIVNADVNAAAAIALSKLAAGGTNGDVVTQVAGVLALTPPTLSYVEATLGANVDLLNTGAWAIGPSVALSIGTWFLAGVVTVIDLGGASTLGAMLTNSAAYEASTSITLPSANLEHDIPLLGIVVVPTPETWNIRVRNHTATATAKIVAASGYTTGAGNNASRLVAVRIA